MSDASSANSSTSKLHRAISEEPPAPRPEPPEHQAPRIPPMIAPTDMKVKYTIMPAPPSNLLTWKTSTQKRADAHAYGPAGEQS